MNNFPENFALWASKGRPNDWDRFPERKKQFAAAIADVLIALDLGAYITSAELCRRLLGAYKDVPGVVAYFGSGTSYLRKQGLLDGCWEPGPPKAGTFGHPSIRWKNPDTGTAGLEDIL